MDPERCFPFKRGSVGDAAVQAHAADVKARYPAASFVGKNRIVFNIKGKKYRLIVIFRPPHVLIRYLGTHAEYDRLDAATV